MPSSPFVAFDAVDSVALPLSIEFFETYGLAGLHYGCGHHFAAAALNLDRRRYTAPSGARTGPDTLYRTGPGALFLQHDARDPLPIDDAVVSYVHSEHVLEHLSIKAARPWLAELRRVLRPGGVLRLTTPDLARYVRGYLDPEQAFYRRHSETLREERITLPEPMRPAWMLNQIFRFWEHRWIYDLDELRCLGVAAGFEPEAITRVAYRDGRDPRAWSLDQPRRQAESLYVELVKS